ncbi:AAEL002281-PA [Aedes aegypti]|uniref:ZAD domain-containing protein n=2 Tax=Aedes aegypti TaxID=7159 RepID=Q17IM0_AEDAE|nr:uncharacterized protein LOC5574198 [Aedes aegypti]XP_021707600.1 uncharacterized protein LOC5574198 [Aedes aegypti]EAT46540.1 AAEL002281-PA [Aedes aegypti]
MDFELSSRFVAEDFCRLCLSSIYELRPLFSREAKESNVVLLNKISLLAEIIMVPSEELDARICSRCVKQLDEFDSFRRRCKDSDNQIRKIRTFRQQRGANNDNVEIIEEQRAQPDSASTACDKFGGIFDIMTYCEDSVAPGEHRMFFDGYVYRCESLLVWRCELAICPCQLIVQHDYRHFIVYRTHSHGKIPLDNDKRKYEKMNQRICAFLNKLSAQIDGSSEKSLEAGPASSSGHSKSLSNACAPVRPTQNRANIYYSTKGDRPSIVVNGYRFHKEKALSVTFPSQIYWRCSAKNCLGMIVTTADLHRFRMHKNHNHGSTVKEPPEEDFSLMVIALPMMDQTPQIVSNAPKPALPNKLNIANMQVSLESIPTQFSVMPVSSSSERGDPSEASKTNGIITMDPYPPAQLPLITMVTSGSSNINALTNTQTSKEHSPQVIKIRPLLDKPKTSNSALLNTTSSVPSASAKDPPVASIVPVVTSTENAVPSRATPTKRKANPSGSPKPKQKPKKPPKTPTFYKPPLMSQIGFYRCPNTDGICLIHKEFVYSSRPTIRYITWQCKTAKCGARVRSGWQLEYLAMYTDHNHEPSGEVVVDVEQHLSVPDALSALTELKTSVDRWPKSRGKERAKSISRSTHPMLGPFPSD